jgi:hypothetical protein
MAILTHDSDGPFPSLEGHTPAGTGAARAYLTVIKRFCVCVLTVLLAGGALAAVIALKTAIYFWRSHF